MEEQGLILHRGENAAAEKCYFSEVIAPAKKGFGFWGVFNDNLLDFIDIPNKAIQSLLTKTPEREASEAELSLPPEPGPPSRSPPSPLTLYLGSDHNGGQSPITKAFPTEDHPPTSVYSDAATGI